MEPVVLVENVSMMFNLSRDKVMGLKEYVVKALKRELHYDEFWALRDVSFELQKGEILGILGLNGSGKSTLLKIVAGVFKPTRGKVKVNGDISPMLELGAGFDIESSARENVFMNGAMFGRSPSHMESIYDKIMDFSELWEFENVPLKNFSSGMHARLGFAVATEVNPDVLILDEALVVGDYKFADKCIERISKLMSGGATVLVVDHSVETIKKICSRAILLEKGKLLANGPVDEVCGLYLYGGEA